MKMGFISKLFVCIFIGNFFIPSCLGAGELSIEQYALLENAVKFIVGPHANVSEELLAFAKKNGGVPRDLHEFLAYFPYFLQQARESGVRSSNGADINPGKIYQILCERGIQWLEKMGIQTDGIHTGNNGLGTAN